MSNKINWDIILDEDTREVCKLNLPDPDLLDYYKRMAERKIYINTDIDESLIDFSLKIFDWNKEDTEIDVDKRKKIIIYINTDGGDLNSTTHFIDVMNLSKTPIITVGLGKCASAGGYLLMAGHERYVFPNTNILIHSGSFGAMGTTDKVLDNLEFTKEIESKIKEFVLNKTEITEKLYAKNYRKDWWLTGEQAVKLKIADKIITDLSEIY